MTVNGESITEDGIEQRTKLNFVNTHKQSVRQDVSNELADDKGKINEAEKLGGDLGDAQVENAYAQMCWRMHIAQEQLKKSLDGNGLNLDISGNVSRPTWPERVWDGCGTTDSGIAFSPGKGNLKNAKRHALGLRLVLSS